jgi:N-acyl-D-amino-acid deacylase
VRAFSSVSGSYPLNTFGEPHNLKALREFLDLARKTDVRMHISHLIFVGARTWRPWTGLSRSSTAPSTTASTFVSTPTHTTAVRRHYGHSARMVHGRGAGGVRQSKAPQKDALLMKISFALLGFNTADMQLASANHRSSISSTHVPGRYRARAEDDGFDNYIDIAKTKRQHRAHASSQVQQSGDRRRAHEAPGLALHDRRLGGALGPAEPGGLRLLPRFLQLARERKLLSLEDAVHRMTGKNAERMRIPGRGVLRKGYAADFTVFDREGVRGQPTTADSGLRPGGIDMVFVNGAASCATEGRTRR